MIKVLALSLTLKMERAECDSLPRAENPDLQEGA